MTVANSDDSFWEPFVANRNRPESAPMIVATEATFDTVAGGRGIIVRKAEHWWPTSNHGLQSTLQFVEMRAHVIAVVNECAPRDGASSARAGEVMKRVGSQGVTIRAAGNEVALSGLFIITEDRIGEPSETLAEGLEKVA
ncbi:MAG: hypothetical protein AAGI09_12270 [Pseudomonadota bacterium]